MLDKVAIVFLNVLYINLIVVGGNKKGSHFAHSLKFCSLQLEGLVVTVLKPEYLGTCTYVPGGLQMNYYTKCPFLMSLTRLI